MPMYQMTVEIFDETEKRQVATIECRVEAKSKREAEDRAADWGEKYARSLNSRGRAMRFDPPEGHCAR